MPERMDRHRHQGHADLLAGRKEHVHLAAGGWSVICLARSTRTIGVLPHGADDHDDLVACCWARMALRAAARIFSALATLVPPNF